MASHGLSAGSASLVGVPPVPPYVGPLHRVARSPILAKAVGEEVWPLVRAGRVRSHIHASFPLERAAEAHALMESSAHMGKIVLEVPRPAA